MRDLEPVLGTKAAIDPFRVHPQIPGIGPHEARNEAGGFKGAQVAVLDRRDIGGPDVKFALHVQQRLAQRGPLAAQDVAQLEFEVIEPARTFVVLRRRWLPFAPDHPSRP